MVSDSESGGQISNQTSKGKTRETTAVTKPAPPAVLSGAEDLVLESDTMHVGIAIRVESGGIPSTLMIPDANAVAQGGSPVYITKPVQLQGSKLKDFLKNKGVKLEDKTPPGSLIGATTISCQAFYVRANGPLLMMFEVSFANETTKGGLIQALTGDADLGSLFEVKSASLRLLRCNEEGLEELKKYAAELSQ